jgi:predicted nucleic acid-binding protein
MSGTEKPVVVYWDASAILSTLLKDENSQEAQKWAYRTGYHFLSHLSYSEVIAVLSRIRRERDMAEILVDAANVALENGPWRRLGIAPQWDMIKNLSEKWPLRGADLWHLSTAKGLQEQFPELQLLTYDKRLKIAAQGEGLYPGGLNG